jgi:hypothetical protein
MKKILVIEDEPEMRPFALFDRQIVDACETEFHATQFVEFPVANAV